MFRQVINSLPPPHIISEGIFWRNLKGEVIDKEFVILSLMGDIHPFPNTPILNCETVWIRYCDKNFVYYWLTRETFPKIKNIILDSHPCEPNVFNRWYNNQSPPNIFVANRYKNKVNRWADHMSNVRVLMDEDMLLLKEKFTI